MSEWTVKATKETSTKPLKRHVPKMENVYPGYDRGTGNSMKNNPFDLTKMWHKKDFPLMPVGEFELNKNPDNYFADVEQAAFSPANVVRELVFPDRMFAGTFVLLWGCTQV